jgi:hypothetical protein
MIANTLRAIGFLAAFAALSATVLPGSPARAESWDMRYVGYLGMIPLLDTDLTADLARQGTRIDVFHATVLLATNTNTAAWLPFEMQLETNGGRHSEVLRPLWHRSVATANRQVQRVDLDYGSDGAVSVFADPPTRETRVALESGFETGTIDPVSAGIVLMDQAMSRGACSGQLPVFDGIRRYDLTVLSSDATPPPVRFTTGPVVGDAIACHLAIEYRSGFPTDSTSSGFYPREMTVWFARLLDADAMVPIAVSARMALGEFRLELVDARAAASGG